MILFFILDSFFLKKMSRLVDTLSISSSSDVIVRSNEDDTVLILVTHRDATVSQKDNLLQVRHKGGPTSSPCLGSYWHYLCVVVVFLTIAFLFQSLTVFLWTVLLLLASIVIISSSKTNTVTHTLSFPHSIGEIMIRGEGNVLFDLQLAQRCVIVSKGHGDVNFKRKTRFNNIGVRSYACSINMNDAVALVGSLRAENSGNISEIHVDKRLALCTIKGGTISYSRSRDCQVKRDEKRVIGTVVESVK